MSDKPVAALITAAVIAPICALCVLGASGMASLLAWFTGWLGGFSAEAATVFAVIVGILVYALRRRRASRTTGRPTVAYDKKRTGACSE